MIYCSGDSRSMEVTMEWTGGCLCGRVGYRVSEDPQWVGYCHCSLCRKQSGAPYTTCVLFSQEAFEWTRDQPSYYRSSEKATRAFCELCGSSLTWETPGAFTVFVGSLDRPEDVQPSSHCYTATKLPWVRLDDNLPHHLQGDIDQWPPEKWDMKTGQDAD